MNNVKLFSYNPASRSGAALSRALGIRRIRHTNSTFRPRRDTVIINWGARQFPYNWMRTQEEVINHPDIINQWADKLRFFRNLQDTNVNIPEFTENYDEAVANWPLERIFGRQYLNSHSGRGILTPRDDGFSDCPLFVRYVPKSSEWRLHFVGSRHIFTQRKVRRLETPDDDINWQIRSHRNGFIYQQNDITVPPPVQTQFQNFVNLQEDHEFPLDFGALDIIYNEMNDTAYVLEVNTAPGITGNTVTAYAEAFEEMIDG